MRNEQPRFTMSAKRKFGNINVEVSVCEPFSYDGQDDCFTTIIDLMYTVNNTNVYTSGWVDFYRDKFHYDISCNELWDGTGCELDELPDWYTDLNEYSFIEDFLTVVHTHVKTVHFTKE